MKRFVFFLIYVLAAFACSSGNNSEVRDLNKDFPKVIELKSEVLDFIPSDSLDDCTNMRIVDNYCFILGRTGDNPITAVDLKSGSISRYCAYGRGPNEFLNPRIIENDSAFMIGQPVSETSYFYAEISSSSSLKHPIYSTFDMVDSLCATPTFRLSNGDFVYTTHNSYISRDVASRFVTYNSCGEYIGEVGEMMSLQYGDQTLSDIKISNSTGYYAKLYGSNCFAYASKLGSYIEFYDLSDLENPLMLRNLYSKSRYERKDLGTGIISYSPAKDCLYSCIDIAASDSKYFVLYIGKNAAEMSLINYTFKASDIYVYSSKGKPLTHYKLDRDIYKICVTPNGKYLYAWSPNPETLEPEIIKYTLI